MKQTCIATVLALNFSISSNSTTKRPEADQNTLSVNPNLQRGTEQRNKQIALQCINAWSNGNIDVIVKRLAVNTVEY